MRVFACVCVYVCACVCVYVSVCVYCVLKNKCGKKGFPGPEKKVDSSACVT